MADTQLPATPPSEGLQPTRDPRVTLPELVEVLLNRGVYLNLDLIITVSDIPLIGVNLRATIAGIETMLEYGMMRSWDERTRTWVRNSISRDLPLHDSEELVAKMAGGHYQSDFYEVWRPGGIFLTTERLIVYRRDPHEMLWQSSLDDIRNVVLRSERTVGGEERQRLHVETSAGVAILSAAKPERLRELVLNQTRGAETVEQRDTLAEPGSLLATGSMWFHEVHSSSAVWRAGTGRLDRSEGFTWKGVLDSRPAIRLRPDEITGVQTASGHTPTTGSRILVIEAHGQTFSLTAHDVDAWTRVLSSFTDPSSHHTHIPEVQS